MPKFIITEIASSVHEPFRVCSDDDIVRMHTVPATSHIEAARAFIAHQLGSKYRIGMQAEVINNSNQMLFTLEKKRSECSPGKWYAQCFSIQTQVSTGESEQLCHVGGQLPNNRSEESEGNAKLFGASKEMVVLLRKVQMKAAIGAGIVDKLFDDITKLVTRLPRTEFDPE